jgi:hypothetical protein
LAFAVAPTAEIGNYGLDCEITKIAAIIVPSWIMESSYRCHSSE